MRALAAISIATLAATSAQPATQSTSAPKPVTFRATDGIRVFGWFYSAGSKDRPVILLFHQAGSNHAEYSTIAPELVKKGFHALAIDQRSGGALFGAQNRTAAQFSAKPSYDSALKDMEGAVGWAHAQGYRHVIAWGSSYSAALVFLLAADHPNDVEALLAFSPGEYLNNTTAVAAAARKVTCPIFIDTAKDPKEIEAAHLILSAVGSTNKTQFEPGTAGVHGSSTLREDRDPQGAAENWKAVNQFLSQLR